MGSVITPALECGGVNARPEKQGRRIFVRRLAPIFANFEEGQEEENELDRCGVTTQERVRVLLPTRGWLGEGRMMLTTQTLGPHETGDLNHGSLPPLRCSGADDAGKGLNGTDSIRARQCR